MEENHQTKGLSVSFLLLSFFQVVGIGEERAVKRCDFSEKVEKGFSRNFAEEAAEIEGGQGKNFEREREEKVT